jgi:hypothetical protein
MDINKTLDLLKQIKQTEAPPFLLTRIKQQLQNLQHTEAPVKWKWAFAVSLIIILALNISTLSNSSGTIPVTENTEAQNIVNSLNLSTQNDFYNE